MSDNIAVRRFVADLLMAVEGLIAVLCGGCTAVVLWGAIQTPLDSRPRD